MTTSVAIRSPKGRPGRRSPSRVSPVAVCVVGAAALVSLVPFVFLLAVSMTPSSNGGSAGSLWVELFEQVPVGLYMLNSAIVTLSATAIVVVLSCMAGFGFAKLRYPGSRVAFGLVVAAISVPAATIILPNYLNLAQFGGIGAYWAPTLLYAVGALPFSIILTTNFFRSLPDELVESAIIDGATYRQIFLSIMVPMAVPALVTVGVLAFLGSWNDLLIGLLFLPDPSMRTISVAVAALEGVRVSNLDLVLTGSLLSAIPPVAAFVIFQKYLVSGITSGISR
jgi:multiple sugar transport system permease protein